MATRGLREILADAGGGVFPPSDGSVTVVPQPSPREAGVLALSAHTVVFTDEDPDWVRATLAATPGDPLAAPLCPPFLTAFARRTGRENGNIDLLTVADRLPGGPPLPLTRVADLEHPRVVRALRYREDVRVFETEGEGEGGSEGGSGVLVLGRGVAGRWECAIEVGQAARGRGLGRALALAARHLVPEGDRVWSQQAPGNATSVRAFQAAGYRPVGAETLLVVGQP
ncbi:GNAT family N-acetyltransferase [Kitasatospora purpeofusca]|uniref:GNAT family N-acetyltransferase n=1 Tax=Kitasatospora purpeofusca TaxID=67352 RepID=UPI0022564B60|nr:GNAT family N-acetyltransferase [Kitasatospora purpeofusca]MCX4683855.1 GNAT family N-acetyltransferase [Kitasatospora purpeofusca]